MAKLFHCKECGEPCDSAWAVKRHKEEKHGAAPRKKRTGAERAEKPARRKYTRRARVQSAPDGPTEPVVDAEAKLLCEVINAFANAETDRAADQRVLEYVALRYGPAAYEEADD